MPPTKDIELQRFFSKKPFNLVFIQCRLLLSLEIVLYDKANMKEDFVKKESIQS